MNGEKGERGNNGGNCMGRREKREKVKVSDSDTRNEERKEKKAG